MRQKHNHALIEQSVHRGQEGAIDLQAVLMMGLGFVFIAVGFIVFQILMGAAETLLDYVFTPYPSITANTFTGFSEIVGVTPLLVLVGFMAAGVFSMYLGVRVSQGAGSTKMDLGVLIMLALAIIFVAIALIILPVSLDSIAGNLAHKVIVSETDSANTGVGALSTNYTLTHTLYNNDIIEVVSVTSNVSTDAPITVLSYTDPKLYIGSLTQNETRTVITTYGYADQLSSFNGVYDFLLMSPLLLMVALIGGAIVTGFFGMKRLGKDS